MDISEVRSLQQNFLKELKDAEAGKKTSLPFIVHQIPETSLVKDEEIFQAIVVGGSVCRKALLKKSEGKIRIIKQERINPALLKKNQDLVDFVEKELYKDVKVVAINLAYPLTPIFENNRLDGVLISGSKEFTFDNQVGKKVGKEIEKYVYKKQKRKIIVSVANDTICLLLSGLIKYSWEELVGGIVGTGINFAFFLDKNKLVNLESANFDKFPQSEELKELDKTSARPGKSLLEKEVSGAYIYKIFNLALKNRKINHPEIPDTKELDDLIVSDDPSVSALAKEVMERSSELTASEIGGIALFKKRNLVFIMEGSLFWIGLNYKEHIKKVLLETVPNLKIKFAKIENSTVLGAGKLIA